MKLVLKKRMHNEIRTATTFMDVEVKDGKTVSKKVYALNVGDTLELPDAAGYRMLAKYPNCFEQKVEQKTYEEKSLHASAKK